MKYELKYMRLVSHPYISLCIAGILVLKYRKYIEIEKLMNIK